MGGGKAARAEKGGLHCRLLRRKNRAHRDCTDGLRGCCHALWVGKGWLGGIHGFIALGEGLPVDQRQRRLHIGCSVIAIGEGVGVAVQVQAQQGKKGQGRGLTRGEQQPQPPAAVRQQPGIALPLVRQAQVA